LVKVEHRATELMIFDSGLSWNILRDSQYAEAVGIAMAPFALRSGKHFTASGDGKVGFVSRWDCVDSAVGLLTGAGEANKAYTLTGPETFSQAEALAIVSRLTGKPIETTIVSTEAMQKIFDDMGVARTFADMTPETTMPWVSEDMLSFDEAIKAGIFDVVTEDVALLSGRKPRTLESVLKDQLPDILAGLQH
jgi:NAD(P)H dehydrogenase (quinone)